MSNRIVTSIPNEKYISDLQKLGFSDFNIHLLDKSASPQKIKQMAVSSGINVRSVHVPYSDTDKVLIENIDRYGTMHYAAMTAELLAADQPVYIVCHTELGKTAAEHPEMIYNISTSIDELLSAYPHVILAIENTMIFNSFTMSISQSALPEYTEIIRQIRFTSNYPNRVCSVLDICHASSTIYTLKKIFPYWKINLEDYFTASSDICSMIHLSNSYNYGYTSTTHGVGFDSNCSDENLALKNIMNMYESYIPDALLVYEISESSYSKRTELKNTMKTMKQIGYEPL